MTETSLPKFQRDEGLLRRALTHRSYVNEHPEAGDDNERLEFLGDAVLGFLVGALLYRRYPTMPEGEMTRRRSMLVDQTQLAKVAIALDLGNHLRLGRGVAKADGRQNPSLLSSALEAVIGAYFLDSGIDAVQVYVERLFGPLLQEWVDSQPSIDAKTYLQQWALAQETHQLPRYQLVNQSGPDHAKTFTLSVWIGDECYGIGCDRSKQEASKRAAEAALRKLGLGSGSWSC